MRITKTVIVRREIVAPQWLLNFLLPVTIDCLLLAVVSQVHRMPVNIHVSVVLQTFSPERPLTFVVLNFSTSEERRLPLADVVFAYIMNY